MKKNWTRLLCCLAAAAMLFTGAALAAPVAGTNYTDGWTRVVGDDITITCTPSGSTAGNFTVAYTGADLTAGNQYVLMIVKLNSDVPATDVASDTTSAAWTPVDGSTITYIDQTAAATTNGVSFSGFIPKSLPDSVVLLGGAFTGGSSPKVLGAIIGHGVSVTGSVTYYRETPWAVDVKVLDKSGNLQTTFTTGTDGSISGVTLPEGDYDFVVSGKAYLPYSFPVTVAEGAEVSLNFAPWAGDVDEDGAVIGNNDLSFLLVDYNKQAAQCQYASDLDHSGATGNNDLSYLLLNYNKQTNLTK